MRIFDLDSPVMKLFGLAADIMIVSGLWVIASIPVITMGTATTAAYYVLTRRISNRESYIVKDFFKAFKSNFRTTALVFLTIVVFLIIAAMNILYSGLYGPMETIALPLNYILVAEAVFIAIHVFPMAARFDIKYKSLLKSAFLMANKHMLTTILHTALLAAILFLCYLYPPLLIFAAGIYCWLSSYMMIRLYRKYRPELDRDETSGEV